MPTDERADFSEPTKRIIAGRSGYRCAFPECNRATIGPGAQTSETSSIGFAAHIYSAADGGPRGQGNLTDAELTSHENGIWLCANHAKLVDNNRGVKYPPALLLSYKSLHESRIARELQGLSSSFGWIHEMRITSSPIFATNTLVRFGKLTLLVGNNGSGKTALCEWLAGLFDYEHIKRWRSVQINDNPVDVLVKYFNPDCHTLRMTLKADKRVTHELDGAGTPLCPVPMRYIYPRAMGLTPRQDMDDLQYIAYLLRVDPSVILNLCEEVQKFDHATARNLRFSTDDDEDDGMKLYADVTGTCPGLPFNCLSGREQERIIIELATALARVYAKHVPTMLILDASITIFFETWFEFYSHHFSDPNSQFQTIVVIPTRNMDITKLRWLGWEVIRTTGTIPAIEIDQSIK